MLNGSPLQASCSSNIDAWVLKHQRDSPVFVPALKWGIVPVVLLLGWYGSQSVRSEGTAKSS